MDHSGLSRPGLDDGGKHAATQRHRTTSPVGRRWPVRWWSVLIACAVTLAGVFVAGYAAADANQKQGTPRRIYVSTGSNSWAQGTSWWSIAHPQVLGSWSAGDLLIATLSAESLCRAKVAGAYGWCNVRIRLIGLDAGSGNWAFGPDQGNGFAFDTADTTNHRYQSHAMTRYLTVPNHPLAAPLVYVEISVTSPDIEFRLDDIVLTVEVLAPA
jgi:hypothetical protein